MGYCRFLLKRVHSRRPLGSHSTQVAHSHHLRAANKEGCIAWHLCIDQMPIFRQLRTGGGGCDLIKKTDKCKPEVMHSTVRHKCIFILYAKPEQEEGGVTELKNRQMQTSTEQEEGGGGWTQAAKHKIGACTISRLLVKYTTIKGLSLGKHDMLGFKCFQMHSEQGKKLTKPTLGWESHRPVSGGSRTRQARQARSQRKRRR